MKLSSLAALLLVAGILAVASLLLWSLGPDAPSPLVALRDAAVRDTVNAHGPGPAVATDPEASAAAEPARTATTDRPALRGRVVQNGEPLGGCTVNVVHRWGWSRAKLLATTHTDADGRFAFHDLEPGRIALELAGTGVPKPWVRRGIEADGERDLGDVTVPVASALYGRVVDEHGAPRRDVPVFHDHRPGRSRARFDRGANLDEVRNAFVETGADGGFAFENLPPGRHHILVEPKEHTDRTLRVDLEPATRHDLGEVQLRPGRRAHGRVFDDRGVALAGAMVAPVQLLARPSRRKGAITGADGAFEVSGLDRNAKLEFSAAGFEPQTLPAPKDASSMVVELRRTLTLTGLVSGHDGRPTTVELERDPRGGGSLPASFVYAQTSKPHTVAADGSFRIRDLGPGDYVARATTAGVGRSASVTFSLPRDEPVRLEVEASATLEVRVTDELGAPIHNARVVRDPGIERYPSLYSKPEGLVGRILRNRALAPTESTDAQGLARFSIDPGATVAVAATHAQHLPTAAVFTAADESQALELKLLRGGALRGTLADTANRTRFSLQVNAWPADLSHDEASKQKRLRHMLVDARGRFHDTALRPGRYRVAVRRSNMTWVDDPSRRPSAVAPLLGDGVDARRQVEVDVRAGQEVEVSLDVAPLGRIRGTVSTGVGPAAGIAMFAVGPKQSRGGRFTYPNGWDADNAYERAPYTHSDAEGKFEFLYADVGEWSLYARHPDAAYPTGPVPVRVTRHAMDVVQDFTLHAGEIRGRFDALQIPEQDRDRLVAYLFRLERASDDAFHSPHHSLPGNWGLREEPVGQRGSFVFRFLPPGVWVLRLVGRRDRIVAWQVVATKWGETVDLGDVTLPATVDVDVPCADEAVELVYLRQPAAGSAQGIFIATIWIDDGTLPLRGIPPGSYELEPVGTPKYRGIGSRGEPMAPAQRLQIHPDGTTEPAALFAGK
ncbi:MAG: carboxypeptidase-like regulatory domain-containing protein [Planctomycetota bacterium]